jgi:hypothetical protein
MLNGYRDREIIKEEEVPAIVEEELKNMHKAYGFEPLSAITKSLWMMHQHPFVKTRHVCVGRSESARTCARW